MPFILFLTSFLLSIIFTPLVIKIAKRFNILDYPRGERHIQTAPVPFMGGFAICCSFFLTLFFAYYFTEYFHQGYVFIGFKEILGILIASFIIMIGGALDDKYNLSAGKQLLFPLIAVFVIIGFGIGIINITNPLGGLIDLQNIEIPLFKIGGILFKLTLLADLFTFLWLFGMMYTTKLLDGLDGLVSGISLIACSFLGLVSLSVTLKQTDTAVFCLILAGAIAGFLIFNFNPAKVYLGEGGSLWLGFIIAVIAIIAGGKITTALLVMGIPMLDVLWIIIRRRFWEKKDPFRTADKKHLHFRLLGIGFTHRQAVIIYYSISLILGSTALIVQGKEKILALIAIVLIMVVVGGGAVLVARKKIMK